MIELIIKILNVILPIFIIIGTGVYCYHKKIIDYKTNEQLKVLLYKIKIPVMMFYFMAKTDSEIINYTYLFLIFVYAGLLLGIAILINHKYFTKTNKETAAASLSWSFANSSYIGLPMAFLAFGEQGMPPAVLITTIYMLVFVSSTMFLSSIDDFKRSKKTKLNFTIDLMKSVFINPIILSSILGLIVALIGIPMPQFIDSSLSIIANSTIGFALLVIGASLYVVFFVDRENMDRNLVIELTSINAFKLIISPLLAFIIIYPFDIDIVWKSVFVLQASLSTGLMAYIVASNIKAYEKRSALAILTTSVLSLATLPIILGLLFSWA